MALEKLRVFISYAWEDEDFKAWVERLATSLREDGIEARLDKWHRKSGQSITGFMVSEIEDSDKVLVVCSPSYKERVKAVDRGKATSGVGYEWTVLSTDIFQSGALSKAVAVIGRGNMDSAVPLALRHESIFDLSVEETLGETYKNLFVELTDQRPSPPSVAEKIRTVTFDAPRGLVVSDSSVGEGEVAPLSSGHRVEESDSVEKISCSSSVSATAELSLPQVGGGNIGGKGVGIQKIHNIIKTHALYKRFSGLRVEIPRGFVVGTDVFDQFVGTAAISGVFGGNEEELILHFLNTELDLADLRENWRKLRGPLAVRSSSLHEDLTEQPLAGVYQTWMLPNNHPDPEIRYAELCKAIKTIYASVFSKKAVNSLKMLGLSQLEEKMAVIVQEAVGSRYGFSFYPHVAGLANSYNYSYRGHRRN